MSVDWLSEKDKRQGYVCVFYPGKVGWFDRLLNWIMGLKYRR
jgi:hypothetical protein